jgi:hypothetical protein
MFAVKTLVLFMMLSISTVSIASAQTPSTGTVAARQSDSLWNGALIGAGAGVASHLLVCRTMEPWQVCRNDFGSMLKFAALGAGVGAGIDALIRKTVYRSASGATAVHASPLLVRDTKGVRLSVTF